MLMTFFNVVVNDSFKLHHAFGTEAGLSLDICLNLPLYSELNDLKFVFLFY